MGAAVKFACAVFGLTVLAACAGDPRADLKVSQLRVTPSQTTAGSDVTLESEITNVGGGGADAPAALEIDIYANDNTSQPFVNLYGWRQEEDDRLTPGGSVADKKEKVEIPADLASGNYAVCGYADPDDEVSEAFEDNNKTCAPLVIVAGPAIRADLVIEKVTPLDFVEASRKVKIKIRNAGTQPASGFKIKAFRRSPRQPLLLTECPITEGQLNSGSPASCGDLTRREAIGPGESAELTGYFAYVVADGAEFLRQPVKSDYARPAVSRTIDFMVDGCFPPKDGNPVYCQIKEIDEINNFREAAFKVR